MRIRRNGTHEFRDWKLLPFVTMMRAAPIVPVTYVDRRLLRLSEWLLVAYFAYTTLLAWLFRLDPMRRDGLTALNIALVAVVWLLASTDVRWPDETLSYVRDWLPAPLTLVAYWEMSWFQPSQHIYRFEQVWVEWDRWLLNHCNLRGLLEGTGWLVPAILELSYTLMYTIPVFSVAVLYLSGRRERVDRFFFTFLLGSLTAYSLFPYFPSEPPRYVFPNQDLPGVVTVFRQFNLWLLDTFDIRTSVFPSGHVTGAFSAAFAMLLALPERKRVGGMLLVLATSIAIATVYGRYHYAVDGAAGFLISLAAASLTIHLQRVGLFETTRIPVRKQALGLAEG
jgi:membrane-associated phospholipid phosphatase